MECVCDIIALWIGKLVLLDFLEHLTCSSTRLRPALYIVVVVIVNDHVNLHMINVQINEYYKDYAMFIAGRLCDLYLVGFIP